MSSPHCPSSPPLLLFTEVALLTHEDFGDFEEHVSLNLGVVFKTLRVSQRLGACGHSSGRSNIHYEGFHDVKLKDAVACGGVPVVAIDFFAHISFKMYK